MKHLIIGELQEEPSSMPLAMRIQQFLWLAIGKMSAASEPVGYSCADYRDRLLNSILDDGITLEQMLTMTRISIETVITHGRLGPIDLQPISVNPMTDDDRPQR